MMDALFRLYESIWTGVLIMVFLVPNLVFAVTNGNALNIFATILLIINLVMWYSAYQTGKRRPPEDLMSIFDDDDWHDRG